MEQLKRLVALYKMYMIKLQATSLLYLPLSLTIRALKSMRCQLTKRKLVIQKYQQAAGGRLSIVDAVNLER